MKIQSVNSNLTPNFGAKLNGIDEYKVYNFDDNYNGMNPDEFLLSRLPQQRQVVYDLGAGQGRNALPIAKKGHRVYAFEINKAGLQELYYHAINNRVYLGIISQNILDGLEAKEKADFVFMSHISQHFKPEELQKVFSNVAQSIKNGGEFVFDALVRQKEKYANYETAKVNGKVRLLDEYGAASFKKDDILEAATKSGFRLELETPFKEKSAGRAWYEKQNLWGGFRLTEWLSGQASKPVELKWFVFKK